MSRKYEHYIVRITEGDEIVFSSERFESFNTTMKNYQKYKEEYEAKSIYCIVEVLGIKENGEESRMFRPKTFRPPVEEACSNNPAVEEISEVSLDEKTHPSEIVDQIAEWFEELKNRIEEIPGMISVADKKRDAILHEIEFRGRNITPDEQNNLYGKLLDATEYRRKIKRIYEYSKSVQNSGIIESFDEFYSESKEVKERIKRTQEKYDHMSQADVECAVEKTSVQYQSYRDEIDRCRITKQYTSQGYTVVNEPDLKRISYFKKCGGRKSKQNKKKRFG